MYHYELNETDTAIVLSTLLNESPKLTQLHLCGVTISFGEFKETNQVLITSSVTGKSVLIESRIYQEFER
jgi:hypothetical protein